MMHGLMDTRIYKYEHTLYVYIYTHTRAVTRIHAYTYVDYLNVLAQRVY